MAKLPTPAPALAPGAPAGVSPVNLGARPGTTSHAEISGETTLRGASGRGTPLPIEASGETTLGAAPPSAALGAAARAEVSGPASRSAPGGRLIEASGETTADGPAPNIAAAVDAAALPIDAPGSTMSEATAARLNADVAAMQTRLSPPSVGPVPAPILPPATPFGSKGITEPRRVLDPLFDRLPLIERLLAHPVATVRQRAEEAQVAMHHGAADMGIKVRAALDAATQAERVR
jgi:hypothetical protein